MAFRDEGNWGIRGGVEDILFVSCEGSWGNVERYFGEFNDVWDGLSVHCDWATCAVYV